MTENKILQEIQSKLTIMSEASKHHPDSRSTPGPWIDLKYNEKVTLCRDICSVPRGGGMRIVAAPGRWPAHKDQDWNNAKLIMISPELRDLIIKIACLYASGVIKLPKKIAKEINSIISKIE